MESRKRSMTYLKKMLDLGINILIFPEGTQNRSGQLLQPFYDGAFRIAIETQQPIMPMAVLGAGRLMPPGKFSVLPGRIRIVVGEEVPTNGLTIDDVGALKDKVYGMVLTLIHNHSVK
jgi:1-acyl-sn-glycerol-3-phosphate acyltransferase